MVAGVLLFASFALMVAGALVFTNAVEWLGTRLDLGHGAVGSVLAGVATAMPESLIPVVAIVGGRQGDEIAIGAIIGAHWKTITQARREGAGAEPARLYFDTTKHDPPTMFQVLAQTLVSLGLLVGAAQLFVSSVEHLAHGLGVDELMLTLIIAPLATELPEKLNSVLWVRQRKDTRAVGNITGAMVFQTMPLFAFGMIFTNWRLTVPALLAMATALAGAALSLITLRRQGGWPVPYVGCWAGLYAGGIASIITIAWP
jgi:cation:H+ antiporter